MAKSGPERARYDVLSILKRRPTEDHELEQFLMPPTDVIRQARWLSKRMSSHLGSRIFMLGDDDHVSIPLGLLLPHTEILVMEYDERVMQSIGSAALRLQTTNSLKHKEPIPPQIELVHYDAKEPVPKEHRSTCNTFYINPPYSSRTEGLGIKVWLQRAREVCVPGATGFVAVPWEVTGDNPPWVDEVKVSVFDHLKATGFKYNKKPSTVSCSYPTANDKGLRSRIITVTTPSEEAPNDIQYVEVYNT